MVGKIGDRVLVVGWMGVKGVWTPNRRPQRHSDG
jgi:hypothetical protein